MRDLLWELLADFVSRPAVADYLIRRAQRTPYFDLEGYMERDWLFNPYETEGEEAERHGRKINWLPSIRIHHILRRDNDRHLHDHPWNARTIILKGWYIERRLEGTGPFPIEVQYVRCNGDTAEINHGDFHSIDEVSVGGVYTMFFTWDYVGTWGFLVNGKKIPWREYLKEDAWQ